MPGVTVLPPAPIGLPTSHSSDSAMQNGYSNNDETVADIKERAKEKAFSVTKGRGISAHSLMRVAQDLASDAQKAEDSGDLKKSLELWVQASGLLSALFNTPDYKAEAQPGKRKEVKEWMQGHAQDIIDKTNRVESKLKELESSGTALSPNSSGRKSIAGRIASLQNAGLSLASAKRPAREGTNGINGTTQPTSSSSSSTLPPATFPSSPISPTPARPFNRLSLQTSMMTPVQPPLTPVGMTPHALIPASSFGPPSPVSSTSDSPKITPASPLSASSMSEFQQHFPTIDELEEMEGLRISDNEHSPSTPHHSPPHVIPTGTSSPIPIPIPTKPFPALPFDLSQRPSSTPIPPTHDVLLGSRPTSPVPRLPLSPAVSRPSILSLSSPMKPLLTPSTPLSNISSPGSSPRTDKPELPKLPKSTVCTPKELYDYMHNIRYGVLILDVRPREEFEKEHIKTSAIVCLEPLVLKRENVTGDVIEDSLHVAPRGERTLFSNRDKFDVIVIADKSSESCSANAALSALVQAIYETAFKKCLRHAPMLLVGGLDAWKREFDDSGIDRGVSSSGSLTPVLNGGISSSSSSSSMRYTSPPYVRNRSGTESSLSSSFTSSDLGALNESPRLPPSMESSPVPSYTPTQSPEVINGFGSSDHHFNRQGMVNGRPPPLHRTDLVTSGYGNGTTPIQYPSYPKPAVTSIPSMPPLPSTHAINEPALPPIASINPYPFSRRRSDYPDQTQEALSTLSSRPVDYPELSSSSVLRPPPVAAAPALERQENRPRLPHHAHSFSMTGPRPPMIHSDYPVTYWSGVQIGISGLKNLGNTCYMNSTIQCLSATVPFSRFFTDGRWKSAVNMVNPLGTKGNLARSFSVILHEMWQAEMPYLIPVNFRKSICSHAPQFSGSDQHDAQEFLSFLLDGLHEDLNRVLQRPQTQVTPEREAELERLPLQIASQQEWETYKSRNDSLVVDFFQGQFRNRMECMTCHKTSTTYNPFMYLSLPIPPPSRGGKVALQACLDALVNKEVMTGSEAWNCPNCKTLRQATKQLSLSRLPPVLMIHLKRFSFKGPFTDKIESFVDFPMKDLDLTSYMPFVDANLEANLPPDDARAQIPPFKYDLYAVTNHFGSLSSGHYTAFIASRGGWMYCDDSRVTQVEAKEVVGKPAYILYYKRVKT